MKKITILLVAILAIVVLPATAVMAAECNKADVGAIYALTNGPGTISSANGGGGIGASECLLERSENPVQSGDEIMKGNLLGLPGIPATPLILPIDAQYELGANLNDTGIEQIVSAAAANMPGTKYNSLSKMRAKTCATAAVALNSGTKTLNIFLIKWFNTDKIIPQLTNNRG